MLVGRNESWLLCKRKVVYKQIPTWPFIIYLMQCRVRAMEADSA